MRRTVVATLVSLALAGCGAQPVSPTQVGGATPTSSSSHGGTVRPVVVRGLPPGPASPDTPPPFRWYQSLQAGQCDGLGDTATDTSVDAPERALFAALAQVCPLLTGKAGQVDWAAARAALDGTPRLTDCLAVAARQLLADVVAAHAAAPDTRLTPGPPAQGTACPVSIDGVELVSPTELDVTGAYLFAARSAEVGSVALQVGPGELQVDSAPPQVRVPLTTPEGFCIPAGTRSTVTVAGDGYEVSADFEAADVGQGTCTQAPSADTSPVG